MAPFSFGPKKSDLAIRKNRNMVCPLFLKALVARKKGSLDALDLDMSLSSIDVFDLELNCKTTAAEPSFGGRVVKVLASICV